MSVLGKDLFDFQRSHTNTKVEFGASGYWVEMIPEMQPYGTVLTEILNLDVTPFQKLLDRLNTAVHEKNYDDAPRAYMDMQKGFGSLPLYRLYLMDFRYFGDMKIEEFVGEEVREAFAKYVINEEREIFLLFFSNRICYNAFAMRLNILIKFFRASSNEKAEN